MRGRLALICAVIGIILMVLIAAAADWLAPYGVQDEYREHSYHPPSKIHFFDDGGEFGIRPFIYGSISKYDIDFKKEYTEDKSKKYFLSFFGGKLISVSGNARLYLLGADSRGRDIFSRILYASRISLAVAFMGTIISGVVGALIGCVAGYYGGKTDQVLMRISEFFIMIPGFYFLLAMRSALPLELDSLNAFILIVVILSFIGWGGIARIVRGMVLSIRERDFVIAAKGLGRGDLDIMISHIIPHTVPYLAITLSIALPGYILGESALSLLGLGIQEPNVSLGNLLSESLAVAHLRLHPWILFPGFFIALISFNFYYLGDVLSEGVSRDV